MKRFDLFIPEFLLKLGDLSVENRAWLDSLPYYIQQATKKWTLSLGEPYIENASCSYVAPCVVKGKQAAVLKIGLPHEEALHEIDGLKVLNGQPSVYLLDFDKASNTMLLEQCIPGTQLSSMPEPQQDEIICDLLSQIWHTQNITDVFRPLARMVALINRETYKDLENFPDPELAKAGCKLKEELIETSENPVLLATDLHASNVLRAKREPWLVIDIKPYVGDRTYDLSQHLLNCKGRLQSDPKATIDRVAQLAGVDNVRLKDWLFARLACRPSIENQELAVKIKQTYNKS